MKEYKGIVQIDWIGIVQEIASVALIVSTVVLTGIIIRRLKGSKAERKYKKVMLIVSGSFLIVVLLWTFLCVLNSMLHFMW